MSEEEEDKKNENEKTKDAESELRSSLRQVLDMDAYDRIMNVSHSNKTLFLMAARQILQLSGRIKRKITEEELVMVLSELKKQTEKKTSITFHSK